MCRSSIKPHISPGHFQRALACGGEAQEMSNQWWVGAAMSDSFSPEVEAISCRGFWLTSPEMPGLDVVHVDHYLVIFCCLMSQGLACIFKSLCFPYLTPVSFDTLTIASR